MPRLSRLLLSASAALALVLDAAPVAAQSAEPVGALPFRAGQWGTEFGASTGFPSVGFLKFRSDRSAWLVDLNVDFVRYDDEFKSPFGDTEKQGVRQYDYTIAAGLRQYRPVFERVAAFTTFGALAGGFGEDATQQDAPDDNLSGWQAGAFGELGGAWMVSRSLSLGASFQSSFVYFSSKNEIEGQGEATRKGFAFNAGETRLLVTLYF